MAYHFDLSVNVVIRDEAGNGGAAQTAPVGFIS